MNALSDEQIDAEWTKAGGPAMTDIATEGHEADATQTIRDFARAVITANFHEHQNSAAIDHLMQLVREAINDSCHMSEYHIETVSLPKIRAEIEALTAIEPWRAKLAEQCGKTLAAQAQRDELRGLLEEACAKIPLPPELVQVSDGEPYDSPGNTPVIVDTGKPPKKGEFAGERCINMAMAAAASVPSWFRYQRMKWDDNPAYAEAKAFVERIRAGLFRCAT